MARTAASAERARPGRRLRRLATTLVITLSALAGALVYLTQPLTGLERRPAVAHVDAGRLAAHVAMLAGTLVPRDASRTDRLDLAASYIRGQLELAGAEVSFQDFEADGRAYRNVVARLAPGGDTPTGPLIVVGAHYDAAAPGVGADDDASGVAGLIELAFVLARWRLPAPVELVAFALEEPPYFRTRSMGSRVHAESLRRRGVPVRAMLSLEMIGYFTDAPDSQRFPLPGLGTLYPTRGDFIAVVGCLGQGGLVRAVKRAMAETTELPVASINAPRVVPGIDLSDHLNYWDAGFDAVMVTDTAWLRNPNYHRASDTPDTLDYRRMAQVVEGVSAAVIALAGGG